MTAQPSETHRPESTGPEKESAQALLPFCLFLLIFVGTGLYLTLQGEDMAFYKYPATVCILPAICLAVFLGRRHFNATVDEFIHGAGDSNVISMCIIFLLSGVFATVARSSGGVDATVALGLQLVPPWLLTPGIFVISAFIATAMGTSMGTSAAIAPVALGIAEAAHIPLPVMAGAVMSGSMFGDNLSIISDTTIAATKTQGCEMKDKFRENVLIALPAAILCFAAYAYFGGDLIPKQTEQTDGILKTLPYLAILLLAVAGVHVFLVLVSGTLLAAVVGLITSPSWQLSTFTHDIYEGLQLNHEIFLLSMLIGGLGRLMEKQGGLQFITNSIARLLARCQASSGSAPSRFGAEAGIAALVALVNICTANNTISIVVVGKTAKEIARSHGVSPRRSASILDIYSCVTQGLLPYGAQALLLGSVFSLAPTEIVAKSFYPFLLALSGFTFFLSDLKRQKCSDSTGSSLYSESHEHSRRGKIS